MTRLIVRPNARPNPFRSTGAHVAKSLVIVESPAKGKTIAGYLGASDYTVMASVGHIRDLPSDKKELQAQSPEKVETHGRLAGINPDDHFDVVYVVHPSKKKVVTELKRALKGADELILATDEDREGEAIGWHVLKVLDPKVPVKRMVFHEITPHAIREALEHPRELDMKLVEAQEARRILDRLVGWETSPILWRVFGRGQAASAGRVQSVAVRLVVERERARMAFRSGQWHDLEGTFLAANADANAQPFGAALVDVNDRRVAEGRDFDAATGRLRADRDVVLLDAAGATALADRLRDVPFRVASVDSDPFTERPRAPFTTSTLQQEAGRKLRFTSSRTMAVAQRLYEQGYITYMRTDSTNLSEQAITAARTAIRQQYGDEYLPQDARAYRSKVKNAQEAHEAIRPAGDQIRSPDAVRAELDVDSQRLYELIWMRTVVCQMVDARGRKVTIRLPRPPPRVSPRRSARPARPTTSSAGGAPTSRMSTRTTRSSAKRACRRCTRATRSTAPSSRPWATRPSRRRATPRRASSRSSRSAASGARPRTRRSSRRSRPATTCGARAPRSVPAWTAFAVTNLLERHFGHLVDYNFTATMEEALDVIAGAKASRRSGSTPSTSATARPASASSSPTNSSRPSTRAA